MMEENHHFWTVRRVCGLLMATVFSAYLIYVRERYGMTLVPAILISVVSIIVPVFLLMFTTFKVRAERQGALREVVKFGMMLLAGFAIWQFGVQELHLLDAAGMSDTMQMAHCVAYGLGTMVVADFMWLPPNRRAVPEG